MLFKLYKIKTEFYCHKNNTQNEIGCKPLIVKQNKTVKFGLIGNEMYKLHQKTYVKIS